MTEVILGLATSWPILEASYSSHCPVSAQKTLALLIFPAQLVSLPTPSRSHRPSVAHQASTELPSKAQPPLSWRSYLAKC